MLGKKFHYYTRLFSILLAFVGLPLSPFLMSLSQFVLLGNWLLEADFKQKLARLKQNKPCLLVIALFGLHLFWLVFTTDFEYGFHDIKIKLPLLIFPFILGSSEPINKKAFSALAHLYILGIVIATATCSIRYFFIENGVTTDNRSISFIISHIRFGLMVVLAVLISGYFTIQQNGKPWLRLLYLGIIIWFVSFLVLLSSMGAFIALFFGGIALLFSPNIGISSKTKWMSATSIFLLLGISVSQILSMYNYQFSPNEPINIAELQHTTPNGNAYYHSESSLLMENGYFVYRNICSKELEEEWNKRSSIKFNQKGKNNYSINASIYRFITSKGHKKDAQGVQQLSDNEVTAIENGIANVDLVNCSGFYRRLHQTVWELGMFLNNGHANGSSMGQRFVYWNYAWEIIKENWAFGVGTGDVKLAFNEAYKTSENPLFEQYQNRAHNQYLTFWIAFGLIGVLLFLAVLVLPFLKPYHHILLPFVVIFVISCINEDTLETQAGVTFFAVWFSFFMSKGMDKEF